MAKGYDKNLQIINQLDIQLNIFKSKTLEMSVLRDFVHDFSITNKAVYNDDDIDMICEALEFLDVVIIDDLKGAASSQATIQSSDGESAASQASQDAPASPASPEAPANSDAPAGKEAQAEGFGCGDGGKLEGRGIDYYVIEVELHRLLNPKKLDFTELAKTHSSAELCRLILNDWENYLKVMYAIRKQL